jgi:hypothetical protein
MFPNTIDRSTGAKTSTTKAATLRAASMSRSGEILAFNSSAKMAIMAPRIFAPRDRGLPFNSIFIPPIEKGGKRGKGEFLGNPLSPPGFGKDKTEKVK